MEIRNKLIGYGGVTQDGNDYASKDGELAVCQGVVNEDGGLRKIVEGADIGLVLESGECVYLHRNVGMGKHYIVLREYGEDGNVLDWYKEDLTRGAEAFLVLGTEEYASAAAIGNILIVTTDKKKYYCLWKDGAYSVLGNDLPEIEMCFTTQGYFDEHGALMSNKDGVYVEGDQYRGPDLDHDGNGKPNANVSRDDLLARFVGRPVEAEWDSLSYKINNYIDEWPADNWPTTETAFVKDDRTDDGDKNWPQLFTDKCYNLLNGIIKDAKEQGLMVMPRLVRAAWRLYDGTYAKFTTPVLVFNSGTHHLTALEGEDKQDGDKNICAKIYPYTIDYLVENTILGNNGLRAKWGDLIKGVTFFASSEVYDYDQQGQVTTLRKTFYTTRTESFLTVYDTHFFAELPRVSEDDQLNQLRNGSPFYKIHDCDLQELGRRYILLQLKRVFKDNGDLEAVTLRDTNINVSVDGSSPQTIAFSIAAGDTLENIAHKIEEAFRNAGVKARVYKMYAPKVRIDKHLATRELGLALVMQNGESLELMGIGEDESNKDTLDIIGLTCYGSPLPSDHLPLKSLETQAHINDDYLQHVDILPQVMDAYNNRLNMANLKVTFRDYRPTWNTPAWYNPGTGAGIRSGSGYQVKKIWYRIRTANGEKVVEHDDSYNDVQAMASRGRNAVLHYLYYPDKRCYKAVVKFCYGGAMTTDHYLELPMKPSDTLNGAVFMERIPYFDLSVPDEASGHAQFSSSTSYTIGEKVYYGGKIWYFTAAHSGNWSYGDVEAVCNVYEWRWHFYDELNSYLGLSYAPTTVNEGIEELKNVVLTTMVDNPLNWEAKGESSVGNSEILALAPNTRALSEGQFGQHPMYAFTTDEGVWAMQIGSDGQLVAVQAVTRDTLTDKKSILQLDTSILFGTDRGIMELAGSKSACMTDRLTGKGFDVTQLKGYATLLEAAGMTLDELPSSSADFRQFVRGCRMAYDYINQRIYVWNPKVESNSRVYNYAYIYSIKGKSWGVIGCTLKEPLNTYPESLVTTDDRKVVKLGAEGNSDNSSNSDNSDDSGDSGNVGKALIVTRPLKVDSLDGLKTLYEVWQRGMIRPADDTHWVKQALYGSRDMYNWRLVGSSNTSRLPSLGGSPYKYYRVVVVASMGDDEFIEGCEIRWRDKYGNVLR